MDWVNPNTSDSIEDDMSSLAAGFSARMHKRVASTQGETTPSSKVSGKKRPKRSVPNEEA